MHCVLESTNERRVTKAAKGPNMKARNLSRTNRASERPKGNNTVSIAVQLHKRTAVHICTAVAYYYTLYYEYVQLSCRIRTVVHVDLAGRRRARGYVPVLR